MLDITSGLSCLVFGLVWWLTCAIFDGGYDCISGGRTLELLLQIVLLVSV